jgi:hypothetical protein
MKIEKVFGYILTILGIFIILWGLFRSSNIFFAKENPPQLFKQETLMSQEPLVTPKIKKEISPEKLQKYIQEMTKSSLQELIPKNTLPKMLNLVSWSIFMGILFYGGGKIASIGIRLICIQSNKTCS